MHRGIDIGFGHRHQHGIVSARSSRSTSASASASVCDILIGSGLAWPGLVCMVGLPLVHQSDVTRLVWSRLVWSWSGLVSWSGLGLVWSGLVWPGLAWPGTKVASLVVRSRNTKGLQNPTPGPSRNEKISAPKKTGKVRPKRP